MESSSLIVVKHNNLIEAAYKLNLDEQRLLFACISKLDSKKTKISSEDKFELTALDYQKIFGVEKSNSYKSLKDSCDSIMTKQITIKSKKCNKYLKAQWVSNIEYDPDNGQVVIQFDYTVTPYLTLLKNNFTQYRIENISRMTSAYAIRMYELLLQYRTIGVRFFDLEELKKILGCEDLYFEYRDFNARVLKTGIVQINKHTDLEVSYQVKKRGKKVIGLNFQIREKSSTEDNPQPKGHKKSSAYSTKKKLQQLSLDFLDS